MNKYFQRYIDGSIHEMACHGIFRSEHPDLKLWEYIDMYLDELSGVSCCDFQVDMFMNILCRDLEVIKKEVAAFRRNRSEMRERLERESQQ